MLTAPSKEQTTQMKLDVILQGRFTSGMVKADKNAVDQ